MTRHAPALRAALDEADDRVVREQAALSASLFMITAGSVRAFHAGEPLVLAMSAGESFGQLSILLGGPAPLSAVAVERTELLVLPAGRLRERLAGNYEAGYVLFRAVAKSVAGRLRRAVQALELARGME